MFVHRQLAIDTRFGAENQLFCRHARIPCDDAVQVYIFAGNCGIARNSPVHGEFRAGSPQVAANGAVNDDIVSGKGCVATDWTQNLDVHAGSIGVLPDTGLQRHAAPRGMRRTRDVCDGPHGFAGHKQVVGPCGCQGGVRPRKKGVAAEGKGDRVVLRHRTSGDKRQKYANQKMCHHYTRIIEKYGVR